MLHMGFSRVTGTPVSRDFLHSLFRSGDRIGIKINTIAGKQLSTRPELALSLTEMLMQHGISKDNIIVWDRTNRELRTAGYSLNLNQTGPKIFGTDTKGFGYNSNLVSHRNIGSRFSSIQSQTVTASISLAILKDHGLAGVTAGMKNYFGAIHNPNKYHDFNCNPFVAELFESSPIKSRHRITILDALIIQYHRGPSHHARWAETYGGLIFSTDPVAADYIGWQTIEKLRQANGLPSLTEEKREPKYIATAEKMGLGQASLNKIDLIEAEI